MIEPNWTEIGRYLTPHATNTIDGFETPSRVLPYSLNDLTLSYNHRSWVQRFDVPMDDLPVYLVVWLFARGRVRVTELELSLCDPGLIASAFARSLLIRAPGR